jgi:hypothetical protein
VERCGAAAGSDNWRDRRLPAQWRLTSFYRLSMTFGGALHWILESSPPSWGRAGSHRQVRAERGGFQSVIRSPSLGSRLRHESALSHQGREQSPFNLRKIRNSAGGGSQLGEKLQPVGAQLRLIGIDRHLVEEGIDRRT